MNGFSRRRWRTAAPGSRSLSFSSMGWFALSCNRGVDRARPCSLCAAVATAMLVAFCSRALADPPFGLPERIPWNSSRLVGSPEPLLPYTVEKTFAKLTWKTPIYIAEEPGTDRVWIVEEGVAADQGSRIRRIEDDPAAGEFE